MEILLFKNIFFTAAKYDSHLLLNYLTYEYSVRPADAVVDGNRVLQFTALHENLRFLDFRLFSMGSLDKLCTTYPDIVEKLTDASKKGTFPHNANIPFYCKYNYSHVRISDFKFLKNFFFQITKL